MEGVTLRTGDKVMHIRNNYDIGWTRDDGEIGQGRVQRGISVCWRMWTCGKAP